LLKLSVDCGFFAEFTTVKSKNKTTKTAAKPPKATIKEITSSGEIQIVWD
jgi:hypothetical protein